MADWLRLLVENRFAIDPIYWGRGAQVMVWAYGNSIDKRREDRRFGAQLARVAVPAPLFILGHWRNGTTLLHELIALDEQFAYPNLFQISHPHTCLVREEMATRYLDSLPADTRPQDNMAINFRSPGEDESAIATASQRSPLVAWSFPRREAFYDRFLTMRGAPAADVRRWKDAFITFLKKMTLRYERPLVLKSPTHTAKVRLLLEIFPNAKFVHIHRDPYTVFRSTRALYQTAVPHSYLQRPDPAQIEEGILRRYRQMYEAFFEDCALIPAGRYCEIGFEDLERDMAGQVQRIYETLRLPGFDRLRPKIEQYAQTRAGYQKNRHQPLAEPLREKIGQAWRLSFERWGYVT
jgi:hypothetical protein